VHLDGGATTFPDGNMFMRTEGYDRYTYLPESIQSFVEKYAPMWKEPPKDPDEIRELQQ